MIVLFRINKKKYINTILQLYEFIFCINTHNKLYHLLINCYILLRVREIVPYRINRIVYRVILMNNDV